MSIGLIVRAENTGLSTLSWEFARHLHPKKVMVIHNGVNQQFLERYDGFDTRRARQPFHMDNDEMDWITSDVDVVISFETFYNWRVISHARKKGVKTALVTMAELFPEPVPIMPSIFFCPSKLDMDLVPDPKVLLPIPIATDRLIWQKRDKAKVFIHSASHGGIGGRKGTGLLIEAMKYVNSDIQLKIFSWQPFSCDDPRVEVKNVNFKNYWQLWREGDVLVYPQGANGICLPIVEAMSCGLGVITTDIYPFNEYMPKDLLFKPEGFNKRRFGGTLKEVDDPIINPKSIAEKIDQIANKSIIKYSNYGKRWAEENSWEKLLPRYKKVLEEL